MARKREYPDFTARFFVTVLIIVAAAYVILSQMQTSTVACTMEAKMCPDGSYVGRIAPSCEFAPCPSVQCSCPRGYVPDGEACTPECYYSIPKCLQPSISCNATCQSDSDCVPAQCCHPSSCINNAYKGVCNLACTASCEGPLDCGAGTCGCVSGRCDVIPS
ncbi:MAG: hypothetical protein V1678_01330 [Candidatus Aenigmatarchaeota archaeon]